MDELNWLLNNVVVFANNKRHEFCCLSAGINSVLGQ